LTFTPKYFHVLRQKKSKSFYLENVQIGFTGLCVSVQNPDPSFGYFFFSDHLIRLKFKVKGDLLKLILKLIFPPNYFKILRQKISKSFYLENIEVQTIIWSSYTGHSNIWKKSGSVVRRCLFPDNLIFGRETIVVHPACMANCDCRVVQSECLASWGS
jgi:hypothetical protein